MSTHPPAPEPNPFRSRPSRTSAIGNIGSRIFLDVEGQLRPIFRAVTFALLGLFLTRALQAIVFGWSARLPNAVRFVALYLLLNTLWLLLSWLFVRAVDQRSFRTLGLWFFVGWGREFARGSGMGAGLMLLIGFALVATHGVVYHGLADRDGDFLLRLVATAAILLLAAAFEEIAFRGYAFQRLLDAWGPLGAVAVSAGLFGAAHLINPSATALSTANTVLAGVLFSVAYLKTRALWLPIGLHWAWNVCQGPILSFPVSGIRFGPALLRAETTGSAWWAGGAYGPEGGALVSVVCVVAIFLLARTRRIAPSSAMREVLH